MRFTQDELNEYTEVSNNAIASAGGILTTMHERITEIQHWSNNITFVTDTVRLDIYRKVDGILYCSFSGSIPDPSSITCYILDLKALQPICEGLHCQTLDIPFPML